MSPVVAQWSPLVAQWSPVMADSGAPSRMSWIRGLEELGFEVPRQLAGRLSYDATWYENCIFLLDIDEYSNMFIL